LTNSDLKKVLFFLKKIHFLPFLKMEKALFDVILDGCRDNNGKDI